ncbi:hypothetical protein ACE10Z_41355 [Bradyrhizobium sp. Pha-3]|uniref:hypothetical protein n=1 Tax=Bradyrhizobium sp. Pha-3 TaxID=208375 RepID=UPI0035D4906C
MLRNKSAKGQHWCNPILLDWQKARPATQRNLIGPLNNNGTGNQGKAFRLIEPATHPVEVELDAVADVFDLTELAAQEYFAPKNGKLELNEGRRYKLNHTQLETNL